MQVALQFTVLKAWMVSEWLYEWVIGGASMSVWVSGWMSEWWNGRVRRTEGMLQELDIYQVLEHVSSFRFWVTRHLNRKKRVHRVETLRTHTNTSLQCTSQSSVSPQIVTQYYSDSNRSTQLDLDTGRFGLVFMTLLTCFPSTSMGRCCLCGGLQALWSRTQTTAAFFCNNRQRRVACNCQITLNSYTLDPNSPQCHIFKLFLERNPS